MFILTMFEIMGPIVAGCTARLTGLAMAYVTVAAGSKMRLTGLAVMYVKVRAGPTLIRADPAY